MNRSKWRPSPGTVLGLLGLTVAIAGTAIAGPLATTSLFNKKEKKQAAKIAGAQVKKLAPGLAVASAGTAGTAGNAEKLDGKEAADFTAAGEVHNSGRVAVDDPDPGDLTSETTVLLTAGSFTVQSLCAQDFGIADDLGNILIQGPNGSSFTGAGTGGDVNTTDGSGQVFVLNEGVTTNTIEATQIIATAPNGQVVTVTASSEVNDSAADCVFSATALGP